LRIYIKVETGNGIKAKPTQKLNSGWEKNCYEKEKISLHWFGETCQIYIKYII